MVDTVRTLTALQALLADNTMGDISPQDARDALVSSWTPGWMRYLQHRLPDETPHVDDDFFTDGSIGGTEVTVSGTATWTEKYDRLHVTGSGATVHNLSAILYALTPSSAPVTIETAFSLGITNAVSALIGPVFTDGTISTSNVAMAAHQSVSSSLRLYEIGGTMSNARGTVSTVVYTHHSVAQALPLLYVRLVWTAADTFAVALSHNGVTWDDFGGGTFSKTMTPTHFGLAVENSWASTAPGQIAFEYVRVYEADLSA